MPSTPVRAFGSLTETLQTGALLAGSKPIGFPLTALLLAALVPSCAAPARRGPTVPSPVKFGVVADCQYCAIERKGARYYAASKAKLKACVEQLNKLDLAYVVHLGDFIDRDYESFDVVLPIWESLRAPGHHVLGNHDFEVADEYKAGVSQRLGMPAPYYDFAVEDWRFVVLDGNQISLYAHADGTPGKAAGRAYKEKHAPEAPHWNGAVGPEQLEWLARVLQRATEAGERAILFCHFPVYPENVHNLWDAPEVLAVIDRFPCVKAYVNGHNHAGNYGRRDGVHYLTMKGMVNTEETAFSVVELRNQTLSVKGFGREGDRSLSLSDED